MRRIQNRKRRRVVFYKQNERWRAYTITLQLFAATFSLSGCDQIQQKLGIEDQTAKVARAEAEGKAVGGACRHSGRAIEDCYSVYTWVPKDAVYTGWRDMDSYMRDNKIETVEPQLPPPPPPPPPVSPKKKAAPAAQPAADGKETKSAEKAAEKH